MAACLLLLWNCFTVGAADTTSPKNGKDDMAKIDWADIYLRVGADDVTRSGWAVSCRDRTIPRPASSTFSARFALKHDVITNRNRYREAILRFANDVDEHANPSDQGMINPLVAAHYYTGDPACLERAYLMALRISEVARKNDDPRDQQCNWSTNSNGTKMLMSTLFQPFCNAPEWGTRGNTPFISFVHKHQGGTKLPENIAFRVWRDSPIADRFEAVNLGDADAAWTIEGRDKKIARLEVGGGRAGRIQVSAGSSVEGRIVYE